jgi:hypothetical protein
MRVSADARRMASGIENFKPSGELTGNANSKN